MNKQFDLSITKSIKRKHLKKLRPYGDGSLLMNYSTFLSTPVIQKLKCNINMEKYSFVLVLILFCISVTAQVQRPRLPKTNHTIAAPSAAQTVPVYYVSNIRVTIRTGNDNKERDASFLLYINERDGLLGAGRNLFTQKDATSKYELKVNTETEIPMHQFTQIPAEAFTLSNLETKGLQFNMYYQPSFFTDAWKIDAVTIILEFKDQFGRLHAVSPIRTIRFNIINGLLTKAKYKMSGVTDGFFTPQTVIITDK